MMMIRGINPLLMSESVNGLQTLRFQLRKLLILWVIKKRGGETFIRNFIVFIVCRMLKGNTNYKANVKILKSLLCIDDMNKLNWCHFTWKSLLPCTHEWKKNKGTYNGPILVLMLCYLDCVVHCYRRVDRRFPLISIWDKKKIAERIKLEKSSGGFGKGKVESRMPIDDLQKEMLKVTEGNELIDKKACV